MKIQLSPRAFSAISGLLALATVAALGAAIFMSVNGQTVPPELWKIGGGSMIGLVLHNTQNKSGDSETASDSNEKGASDG